MVAQKEKIYTPDSGLATPISLLNDMCADLSAARELAWRLLVRNISARYRQSFLGYFWAFVPPLFTTMVWVFLRQQDLVNTGPTAIPYSLFVLTGTILWWTFVDAIETPLKIINESHSMLSKINFPREALILTSIGEVGFNFMVRLSLLLAFIIGHGHQPSATALLFPFGILSLILMGTVIGVLLAPLGALFQDVGRATAVGTQAWFFMTPIIYPLPVDGWASHMVNLNPVTPLLVTTRAWLLSGEIANVSSFIVVSTISSLVLLIAWVFYRISMPHMIARMST